MSRSGYTDDPEDLGLWRAAVARALRGRRGQAALRDIAAALDAMPQKRLASNSFQREGGEVCTLGALAASRGVDMSDMEPHQDPDGWTEEVDRHIVGKRLNIAPAMSAEVMFMNDEGCYGNETPEERWTRMRAWVGLNLLTAAQDGSP